MLHTEGQYLTVQVNKKTEVVSTDESVDITKTEQGDTTIFDLSVEDGASIVSTTIAEVRTMISNSSLTAGQLYRITDYQCEIRSDWASFAQSAGNRFDVILLATSESTLNKKGWAIQHEGDTYFANQDLQNWQVWFDVTLGTYGRVIRLIDDKRNDCLFDFKNVKWLDFTIQNGSVVDGTEYLYTFNLKENNVISDFSLNGKCYDNSMKEGCYRIIFHNNTDQPNYCYNNTFGNNCHFNTFGNYCYSNIFGEKCSRNTFGNWCNSNTFGDNCDSNTFGYDCQSNTFGDNCDSNTFGDNCDFNTFGNGCQSNTFGNSCEDNIFRNNCRFNTFGFDCNSNTFGNEFMNKTVSASFETTEGTQTKAMNNQEHASGRFNESIVKDESNNIAGTLFTIGNGYVDNQTSEIVRRNAFRVDDDGAVYTPQMKVSQQTDTLQNVSLNQDGQLVIGGGSSGGASIVSTTIAEVRTMINNSGLTAGQLYRITDYQCEIRSDWSSFAQSAGNRFDVILLATSENTLNKKGWAIQHEGDTYFANQDLQNWQVWFDVSLGTYGRVLRLIDDKRNDCPYDFKNVKWLDFTIQNGNVVDGTEYLYTFNYRDSDENIDLDFSSLSSFRCFDNTIRYDSDNNSHRIIFSCTYTNQRVSANFIDNNCGIIKFGNLCNNNYVGVNNDVFLFGNQCLNNSIGGNSDVNIFGDGCMYNTFGNSCNNNTFGNYCSGNTFGNYCGSNTFGYSCSGNTFGSACNNNTFGNYCYYNTFGNYCSSNTFGNSSSPKNYYQYNILSNGCSYLYLDTQGTTSASNCLQNVRVGLGVSGTESQRKTLTVPVLNANYEQRFEATGSTVINV